MLHGVKHHGLVLRKGVIRILVHQPDLIAEGVVHDVVDGLFQRHNHAMSMWA